MPLTEAEELELLELEEEEAKARGQRESVTVSFAPSTATDEELHEANLNKAGQTRVDTPMGGKAVIPLAPPLAKQASTFMGAPKRALGSLLDMAKDIGRMDEPLDQKLLGYGKKAVGGLGDALGKLVYGSPVEQAEVAGDMTLATASGNIGRGLTTRPTIPSLKQAVAEFKRGPGASVDKRAPAVRKLDDALATFNTSLGVSATDPAPFFPGSKNQTAWNVARDNAIAPFVEKLVKPVDTFGMKKLAEHTTNRFWEQRYGQFEEFMQNQKVAPERVEALAAKLESSLDPMVDKAGNRMLTNFAKSLRERNDWSFDDFEHFRRQFNEKQKYKKGTTTSDVAQRREIILGEVRSLLNDQMDDMIDQGVPMADVLRQYRDMRMVSDRVNDIAAAASQAKSVKDVVNPVRLEPATTVKGSAIVTARASAQGLYKKHIRNTSDPDFLMRKATAELIKQKDRLPVPEVVKKGIRPAVRKPIQLGPSEIAPPDPSGPAPMGPQGLAGVFDNMAMGAPTQKALPPASIKLPGSFNVVPPTGGNYPTGPDYRSVSPTRPSPNQLFKGDIRGGYGVSDPAQQAEKRRAILGKPYIDPEGNIKYRK